MNRGSILIVGKKGILHWQEDLKTAFEALGCRCSVFHVNPDSWEERIHKKRHGGIPFGADAFRERFSKALSAGSPQLIIFLNMPSLPQNFLDFTKESAPKGILTAGWMADCVTRIPDDHSGLFDRLYYFDSHMKPLLEEHYGDGSKTSFLPLAVNENKYQNLGIERNNRLLFAGTCSEDRIRMFNSVKNKLDLDIHGPRSRSAFGMRFGSRLSTNRLNQLFNTYDACLNINQKPNTVNGLNLRPYEASAAGCIVFNENVSDLSKSFEPEKEILTYGGVEELFEKFQMLSRDSQHRKKIAAAGAKKTLCQHTFTHRAEFMLNDLGI